MAVVIETGKTFKYGPQDWKYLNGNWFVLMFGWFPGNTGTPSYLWEPITKDRVPKELLKAV